MTAGPHAVPTLHVAHDSPGRLRVRVGDLRANPAAVALADALAAVDGVLQVSVRPRTGSVLYDYDPRRTDAARLLAALRRQLTAHPPGRRAATVGSGPPASRLRRAVDDLFRSVDADVAAATGGRLDLGTLTGLGLLGAGAAEIAVTRTIPAPPWFSLAWWAFRTFTMFDSARTGAEASAPTPAPRRVRGGAQRARQ